MGKSKSRTSFFILYQMIMAGLIALLISCQDSPTKPPRIASSDSIDGTSSINGTPKARTTPTQSLADGDVLYAKYCETCHSKLEVSAKAGANAQQIADAIGSVPEMNGLQAIKSQEIEAIANALATVRQVPPVNKPTPAGNDDDDGDDDGDGDD